MPFSLKQNLRKLPIVGDVHLSRGQWPNRPEDWLDLWALEPMPPRLNRLVYTVNEQELAFTSISLQFARQEFESFNLHVTPASLGKTPNQLQHWLHEKR